MNGSKDGGIAGWVARRIDQSINVQTDEAINPSKLPTVHSNTSSNPGTASATGYVNEPGKASPLYPSIFLPAHCRGEKEPVCPHSMQSPGPAPSDSHRLGTGFYGGGSKPGTQSWPCCLPPQGKPTARATSSPQPSPTTVVCFLNKP